MEFANVFEFAGSCGNQYIPEPASAVHGVSNRGRAPDHALCVFYFMQSIPSISLITYKTFNAIFRRRFGYRLLPHTNVNCQFHRLSTASSHLRFFLTCIAAMTFTFSNRFLMSRSSHSCRLISGGPWMMIVWVFSSRCVGIGPCERQNISASGVI